MSYLNNMDVNDFELSHWLPRTCSDWSLCYQNRSRRDLLLHWACVEDGKWRFAVVDYGESVVVIPSY